MQLISCGIVEKKSAPIFYAKNFAVTITRLYMIYLMKYYKTIYISNKISASCYKKVKSRQKPFITSN